MQLGRCPFDINSHRLTCLSTWFIICIYESVDRHSQIINQSSLRKLGAPNYFYNWDRLGFLKKGHLWDLY